MKRLILLFLLCVTPAFAADSTFNGYEPDYTGESAIFSDLNCDGRADVVVSARNSSASTRLGVTTVAYGSYTVFPINVNLWEAGGLTPGLRIVGDYQSSSGAIIASVGDYQRNGCKNLLVSSNKIGDLYTKLVFGNKNLTGNYNLRDMPGLTFTGVYVSSMDSGYIDSDQYLDFVFGETNTGEIFVWYGNGVTFGTVNLRTQAVVIKVAPNNTVNVHLGKFNRDPNSDIVFAANVTRDGGLFLGSNTRLTSSSLPIKLNIGFAQTIASVGDLDNDGISEIGVRGLQLYTTNHKTAIIKGQESWTPVTLPNDYGTKATELIGLSQEITYNAVTMSPAGKNMALFGDPLNNRVALFKGGVLPAKYTFTSSDFIYTGTGFFGNSVSFVDNVFGGDNCGINLAYLFGRPGFGQQSGKVDIYNITKP